MAFGISLFHLNFTEAQILAGPEACESGNYCTFETFVLGGGIQAVCEACCPTFQRADCSVFGCGCTIN